MELNALFDVIIAMCRCLVTLDCLYVTFTGHVIMQPETKKGLGPKDSKVNSRRILF